MSKRRTHSPEFKARVAMEAISGRKTIQEIAADHAIHPIQVSQWKRQLLDGASELFTCGKQSKDKEEVQAKEAELFQQIGRLQMELEWLKKNLSCSDARELRNLVDHDHHELSVSRQCVLLGLPRSTLYYRPVPVRQSTLRIMARIDALYLEDPCSGSRRMVAYLAREGIPISRDRVRPHVPGVNYVGGRFASKTCYPFSLTPGFTGDLPETPHHGPRRSIRAISLPGGSQGDHGCGSSLGHRHHLHPVAERLPVPGGDHGSPLQARTQLEALQQP